MGAGTLRNKDCECGSGSKHKKCCEGLSYEEMLSKKRKIYFERAMQEANIKLCLYPDHTDCSETIIKAHSIQNNKILIKLSDKGEIYMPKPAFMDFGDTKLQKIGRAKATTFTGFCRKHDTDIFLPIENKDYTLGDSQQNALFAFRAFTKEWHAKLVAVKLIESIDKQTHETAALLEGNKLALKDIEEQIKIFEDVLIRKEYEKIETRNIIFGEECNFSVSSGMTLPYDFKGNELAHFTKTDWDKPQPLFITIFPQEGKTHVILSFFKESAGTFKFLDNQLINVDEATQKELLSRLILHNCENVVISPRMIEEKTEEYKKLLTEKYSETVKIYVDESVLDKPMGISLFD